MPLLLLFLLNHRFNNPTGGHTAVSYHSDNTFSTSEPGLKTLSHFGSGLC